VVCMSPIYTQNEWPSETQIMRHRVCTLGTSGATKLWPLVAQQRNFVPAGRFDVDDGVATGRAWEAVPQLLLLLMHHSTCRRKKTIHLISK
jgi:hypothetical protein